MTHLNHQPCPYIDCGSSDAFSWNTEKQVGYCNSCGKGYPTKHMSVHSWAKEQYPLKELDKVQAVQSFSKPQAVSYREDFFGYRGITYDTMKFYKCLTQFDEANNPISHKYVYPSGSIHTRVFPKSFHVASGFKSDELFGMNLFGPGSAKAVTITEGQLDAMSAFQMLGSKYPVVSLPSATPSKKLLENCYDWLDSFEKIYLSIDTDEKAEGFALSLMRLFPGRVYKVNHGSLKDANEFLQKGKQQEYSKAWWNSKLYTPDNIYSTEEDFLTLLHDTPDHTYVPTGIKALDEKILGLMQGHFTVIKAPTGIGKSELMRYLEYNFIHNFPDVKFAVWHLEETKLRSLLGVVSYYLHDNVTRKDLIEQKGRLSDVESAIKHITNNTGYLQFHMREEDGADDLVDQIRMLTQVYDCKYVLFEPVQDVVTVSDDKSKESVLADLSIRLSKLAADLNVGIVTIAHTNENGDPKYCKMIAQRASVVIDLERDKESENPVDRNTTKLVVKKNRPTGLEGFAGELLFDMDSFTLSEKGDSW